MDVVGIGEEEEDGARLGCVGDRVRDAVRGPLGPASLQRHEEPAGSELALEDERRDSGTALDFELAGEDSGSAAADDVVGSGKLPPGTRRTGEAGAMMSGGEEQEDVGPPEPG